jgi:limonene-1,2-epoxide hydrolase
MTPTETVTAFIDCWNRFDTAGAIAMLSPDIFYHNIPMPPARGLAEVAGVFQQFPPFTGVEWITHNIAANGNVVLTERTDKFRLEDGRWIALPVMGAFEVGEDGKITHWRDYFDLNQFTSQVAGEVQG